MKKVFMMTALLALVGLCAVAANAAPTFMGATGGVALPDAEVVPMGTFDVAADYHRQRLDNGSGATHARITYGLNEKSEIGFQYTWQSGKNLGDGFNTTELDNWGVNAKYAKNYKPLGLDFALGGQYAKYKRYSTKQSQIYLVAGARVWESMEADKALDVNIGINWIKFDVPEADTDKLHAFTVLSYTFSPSMQLVGEYQTKADPDAKALSSLMLRYKMADDLSLQAGLTNSFRGVTGAGNRHWFAGACYRFNGFSD